MNAASAFLSTVIADSVVEGFKEGSQISHVSAVWPAVLRNAAAVAIIGAAANVTNFFQSFLLLCVIVVTIFFLRMFRNETDTQTSLKRTATDAIVISGASLMVVPTLGWVASASSGVIPFIGGMSDNIQILIALAIVYNEGRKTTGAVLNTFGLQIF